MRLKINSVVSQINKIILPVSRVRAALRRARSSTETDAGLTTVAETQRTATGNELPALPANIRLTGRGVIRNLSVIWE